MLCWILFLFLFSNICRFECLFSQIQTTGSYLGGTMTRVTKWIDAPFCRQSKLKLFAQNQVFSNRDFSFSTTHLHLQSCTFQSFYNARFRVNLEHSCDFYSVNTEYKNCIVSEIFGVEPNHQNVQNSCDKICIHVVFLPYGFFCGFSSKPLRNSKYHIEAVPSFDLIQAIIRLCFDRHCYLFHYSHYSWF